MSFKNRGKNSLNNYGNKDLYEEAIKKIRNPLERGKIEIEHKYFERIEEHIHSWLFL